MALFFSEKKTLSFVSLSIKTNMADSLFWFQSFIAKREGFERQREKQRNELKEKVKSLEKMPDGIDPDKLKYGIDEFKRNGIWTFVEFSSYNDSYDGTKKKRKPVMVHYVRYSHTLDGITYYFIIKFNSAEEMTRCYWSRDVELERIYERGDFQMFEVVGIF